MVVLLACAPWAASAAGPGATHVLLLHSYHSNMTWVRSLERGIEEDLLPARQGMVLHVEYMDTKRNYSDAYLESLAVSYRLKYQNVPLSLIISSDNHAFDFLRSRGGALFPGVPVVFCGVNDFKQEQIAGHRAFTGVADNFAAAETVELALRLHPGTREVFVVNDYLKTGRAWERAMREQVRPLQQRVRFTYAENLGIEELRARIAGLAPGTIVLLGVYFSDLHGQYMTYERIGERIAEASPVPVYCLLDFNVGPGVVGGKVVSGYHQGKMAAQLGRRVLAGEDPADIPVLQRGVNWFIFNHRELERFGIDEASLPEDSMVVNRPFSLYRQYKVLIWTVSAFILALFAAIAALVNNILQRRRAQKALRESQRKLRAIFDQTFQFIGLLDLEGTLLNVNGSALAFCGVGEDEVIGKPFWQTPWWRHSPREQARLRAAIRAAAAGDFQRYEAILPALDGSSRTFDFSIKPVEDETGRVVFLLPEGRDISERKRAETALRASEVRFRSVFESAAVGIAIVSTEGRILQANPALCRFLGYPREALLKLSVAEITHPDDRLLSGQLVGELERGERSLIDVEKRYLRKDGSIVWGRVSATRVVVGGEEESYTVALIQNVTRQKRAEEALEQSLSETRAGRDRIDAILNSVADGLIVTDPRGRITLMNLAAEVFLGQALGEVAGRSVDEVIRSRVPSDRPTPSLVRAGALVPVDLELRDGQGQPIFAQAKKATIRQRVGSQPGMIISLRDLTREREIDRLKREFLSTAAHELRTPLTVIRGFAELLQSDHEFDAGQKAEFIDQIYDKTEVLARIIDNLLDLSRAESGRLIHIEKEACDLGALLEELVAQYRGRYPRYDFTLALPGQPLRLLADGQKIALVADHLLDNAVKFSPDPGPVRVACALSAAEAVVSVEDEGIGLTPEQAERVFERFYRVDASSTAKAGMGMGMALARNIVEAHGGRIWIESVFGRGTKVSFALPLETTEGAG